MHLTRRRPFPKRRGTVMIVTLGILGVMSMMGAAFAQLMQVEYQASKQYVLGQQAAMLAHDGIVATVGQLQREMSYRPYSRLSADYYGVDPLTGSYRDMSGEYKYFGGKSGGLMDPETPVNFPYPYVDGSPPQVYIDVNATGDFNAGTDFKVPEPDPANSMYYDSATSRAKFSGFALDGLYLGGPGTLAGTYNPAGDRYKVGVISTNSQLNLNYIGDYATVYDWQTLCYDASGPNDGAAFKYMLTFLGSAICAELAESGTTNVLVDPSAGGAFNPFDPQVVDALWDLRQELGGKFTAKEQVRDVVESFHPGSWQYIKDFITVHAWPGHDPIYGQAYRNTIVPQMDQATYESKMGILSPNPADPSLATRGNPAMAGSCMDALLPPVDVNLASIPVIYSAVANIAGDARYHYFSSGALQDYETAGYAPAEPFIEDVAGQVPRIKKYYLGNNISLVHEDDPTDADSDNYFYAPFSSLASGPYSEYKIYRWSYDLTPTGTVLFQRNIELVNFLRIDPFRGDFFSAQSGEYALGGGAMPDYAWNLSQAIEDMRDARPFTSWADFVHRVVDEVILDEANLGTPSWNPGHYVHSTEGSLAVCQPYESWNHPWNQSGAAGNVNLEIDQDVLKLWYFRAVGDLLKANFNPSPKLTNTNPDSTYYQIIDRGDLVYYTVPFIFNSPGVYEITSVGEILGNVFDPATADYVPKPLVQKQFQSVVQVAEIRRFFSQQDFATGFPATPGPFADDAPGEPGHDPDTFFSVPRLTAGWDPDNPGRSLVSSYPLPLNEDILNNEQTFRVPGHQLQTPSDAERALYYRGFRDYNYTDLLGGRTTAESLGVGWLQLRPQDFSPFDPEVRITQSGQYYGYSPPGGGTVTNYPGADAPMTGDMLLPDRVQNPGAGDYVLFWMPFNETIDTVAAQNAGSAANYYGSGLVRSAYLGSIQPANPWSGTGNPDDPFASFLNLQNGPQWSPDGFLFRYSDRSSDRNADEFPEFLVFPTGIGFEQVGSQSYVDAGNDTVSAHAVIEEIPSTMVENNVDTTAEIRANQDMFQCATNFPHYHGLVEFWFKSDIDQWDYAPTGTAPEVGMTQRPDPDDDRISCGFFSATTLLYSEPDEGIMGCQTFFYRTFQNYLVAERIYFVEALQAPNTSPTSPYPYPYELDASNNPSVGKYTSGDPATADPSNPEYPLLSWLQERGDVVEVVDHYNPATHGYPPSHPSHTGTYTWDPNSVDKDPLDYGFMFARYDAWVNLNSVYEASAGVAPGERGFVWRPHEWYHLGLSFRSNEPTRNDLLSPGGDASGMASAIDFYLNGVWLDGQSSVDNPLGMKTADHQGYINGINWPLWYSNSEDNINDGAEIPDKTGPDGAGGAGADVWLLRKWGCIVNEINPRARLTIGAITRDQISEDQLTYYNANRPAGAPELDMEMFAFGDGRFVVPANGTIDSFRVSNKYINETSRNGWPEFGDADPYGRARLFARYNTDPTNPSPETLGCYENGLPSHWNTDVRIANVTWNEYRPAWDSVRSMPIEWDQAPSIEFEFRTYEPEVTTGTGDVRRVINSAHFHQGFGDLDSGRPGTSSVDTTPIEADRFDAAPDPTTGKDTVGIMGRAFPVDETPFVLPKDGVFSFVAKWKNGETANYAANSTAVLDEVTVTVLIPVRFLTYEEVYG